MMMHPDDFEKIMRICTCVAVVWVCTLSFRIGRQVFHMMEHAQW